MATIPQVKQVARKTSGQETRPTLEEGAAELYHLLEQHFDEMGLTEAERDERYARAERRVISANAAGARSAT